MIFSYVTIWWPQYKNVMHFYAKRAESFMHFCALKVSDILLFGGVEEF